MSARGIWIVALGAALAFLIALNVFRSEPGGPDLSSETVTTQRPVEAIRGSADQSAVAPSAPSRDAPAEPQPVPTPLPTSGPYASISAALADQDLPPERRMQPVPEMLETERAFAAESADPQWSTATEAAVLGRIAEIPGAAYASVNVECRTTLCLLQFVESAAPAPKSGIVDVDELVKPQGLKSVWMMGIRVRGGAPVGIAYLQRVDDAGAPAGAVDQ
jgi:hypothetical protein